LQTLVCVWADWRLLVAVVVECVVVVVEFVRIDLWSLVERHEEPVQTEKRPCYLPNFPPKPSGTSSSNFELGTSQAPSQRKTPNWRLDLTS
jgi:hypothetical protein